MNPDFRHPFTVRHQGRLVAFVAEAGADGQPDTIWYDVLAPRLESESDDQDWVGYQALAVPPLVAPLGMSLVRVARTPVQRGPFQVVTDQRHVYVFRVADGSILAARYLLVEVPSARAEGSSTWQLQPAWEVRYQRSGNPDVPATDRDTQSFLDVEDQPFLEPLWELALAERVAEGSFAVSLLPTNHEATLRWQLVIRGADGRLRFLSFDRDEDGWPAIAPDQVDPVTHGVRPDAVVTLTRDDEPLAVVGPPAMVVYNAQEPAVTVEHRVLSLRRAGRLLVACEVGTPEGGRIATLDAAIDADGLLACLEPGTGEVSLPTGVVQPAQYTLAMDGSARVELPSGEGGLSLAGSFTLEAWIRSTATDGGRHTILGGAADAAAEQRAPALWVEDRLRIGAGFGDGVGEVVTRSAANVLTEAAWNHVALTWDGARFRLYVNGDEAELVDAAHDATPAATPLTAIGDTFVGDLDEMRVWDVARTQAELRAGLYAEIPDAVAKEEVHLVGYWRLDEGSGTVAVDTSASNRDGVLHGPQWVAGSAPIRPATEARTTLDDRGLALLTGVLEPVPETFPRFGTLLSGSRPWLLDGSDGRVHLYVAGDGDGELLVSHLDTAAARAIYELPWVAAAPSGDSTQRGVVQLASRQLGTVANQATITVSAGVDPLLCDVVLDDGRGQRETWTGVPRAVHRWVAVLSGRAIPDPGDARLRLDGATFYDYPRASDGGVRRHVGYLAAGDDPLLNGQLVFLSRGLAELRLLGVRVGAATGGKADVTLELASDAAHSGETLTRTLPAVPVALTSFVSVLRGASPTYDYAGSAGSGTLAWSLPAGRSALVLLSPDPAVTSARVEWVAGATGLDLAVALGGVGDQAAWEGLPVQLDALIAALRDSRGPEQRAVVDRLRFWAADPAARLDVGPEPRVVDQQAPSTVFTSLLEVLSDGARGTLATPATVVAAPIQRATTSTGRTDDLQRGSALFAAMTGDLADNGYPAIVEVDRAATRWQAGADGGWIAESPRNALFLDGRSGLRVDLPPGRPLDLAGDLTLEAWTRVGEPVRDGSQQPRHPRLLDANPTADGTGSRYLLGLSSTYTLQLLSTGQVRTDDAAVPDDQAGRRLFPYDRYTLSLWLWPDLATSPGTQRVLRRASTSGKDAEQLDLDAAGNLTWTVTDASGGSQVLAVGRIPTASWTWITVRRVGPLVTFFLDGLPVGAPVPTATVSTPRASLTLAGNPEAKALQQEMVELCLWSRGLTDEEVAAQFRHPVPRDAEGLQLRWGLDEGDAAGAVPNSAIATSGLYDTRAEGSAAKAWFWDSPGVFYRATAAGRGRGIRTRDAVIAPDAWTHLAARYATRFGLALDGRSWGDAGNDATLDVEDGLSVEAWVVQRQRTDGDPQAVLAKFGQRTDDQSWRMGLDRAGRPSLTVVIDGQTDAQGRPVDDRLRLHTFTAPAPVVLGRATWLVGTMELVTVTDAATQRPATSVVGQVYVDGEPTVPGPSKPEVTATGSAPSYELRVLGGTGSGRYPAKAQVTVRATDPALFQAWRGETGDDKGSWISSTTQSTATVTMPARDVTVTAIGHLDALSVAPSTAPAQLGQVRPGPDGRGQEAFVGTVAELRLWGRALTAAAVRESWETGLGAPSGDGLISSWSFAEQEGRVAYDDRSDNNLLLSSSEAWVTFHEAATLSMLVGGQPVPVVATHPDEVGGYGATQVTIGGFFDALGAYNQPLRAELDELRVWSRLLTDEQIADSKNRYLPGDEPGLAGYWTFDTGSGRVVVDRTGRGSDARFWGRSGSEPRWVPSTAPISDEAPLVANALGTAPIGPDVAFLSEGPAVTEYGDLQADAAGELFSVMKRAYVARDRVGRLRRTVGYKVGDLVNVYVGQVQSDPTVIGYVEGPPPLPSENLVRPTWTQPTTPAYTMYDGRASVTVSETRGASVSFSASRQEGNDRAYGAKGGVALSFTSDAVIGLPPIQSAIQNVDLSGKAGVSGRLSYERSDTTGASRSTQLDQTFATTVANGGAWERPSADASRPWFLDSGERRYLPDNVGTALVKSSTADLFSQHLRSTGALVSMAVVPNPDIPEDLNLITFPIAPRYVKNGTLDGRVGLQDDPDWPEANVRPGSYFKPAEAYALRRSVERRTRQLMATYGQINAARLAEGGEVDLDAALGRNDVFDWEAGVPSADMYATWVWTAAGGLYRETQGYVSTRQETQGGSTSWSLAGGVFGEAAFTVGGPVGLFFEADATADAKWTTTVTKERQETSAVSLEVEDQPEDLLTRWLGPSADPPYTTDDVPGKVESFRLMTFYLSPRAANTDTLFDEVIDPAWLATSSDAAASALREARARTVGLGCWRVLHRVTYVSRVPPAFDPFPVPTEDPSTPVPANLDHNTAFLELVRQDLGSAPPTPANVGTSVRRVLDTDLSGVLPWWSSFLAAAAVPNSPEADALARTTADAIAYTTAFHATTAEDR